MRILVVGSGGREHALIWRLAATPGHQLFALPGNPGIAKLAECIPTQALSPASILGTAQALGVELTIVGPEAPLIAGVANLFDAANQLIIGPRAESARLEGSKMFAKQFFEDHRIPTARFESVSSYTDAISALSRFPLPVVIKADGLAGGKGVSIASTRQEAEQAIQALGPNLVVEEFLNGKEVSFIVLSDGRTVVPLTPCRDHKRAFDGNLGPNTGGMGAFCDPALLTDSETEQILEEIIRPTVKETGFTGFLYAGLMMTSEGPKLLEYNVRLGDPETQVLMHRLNCNFGAALLSAAQGELSASTLDWKAGVSHCVVLASSGYPGPSRTGDEITGIDRAEACDATVFHNGTKVSWSGYATTGGRVLTVTSSAASLKEAAAKTYRCLDYISFEGMQYRRDIGGIQTG